MANEYKDWQGKDILVGSIVLYVVAHSSSVELVEGEVVSIDPVEFKTNWGKKQRTYTLDVRPRTRNLSGWITQCDENDKIQKIVAVERVTVLD